MDLHTNDSSESAAGVFVSDKCQIPVGGIPQQEPDRQQYYMALCRQKVQEISDKLGRPLTCFISTFGCQMNAHDSEKLLGILLEAGFVEGTSEESDFVLYNTCTVRENANLRVYGRLGYLHSLKKKNPHMMIALCGCMMQEPEVVEKLKKSYRFVDLIFGTHNVYKLAELLEQRFETGKMVIDIWKGTDKIVEDLPSERKYTFKSGVNIMFGCNNFCSYCIVPYVRGRERSRAPEDIIREIEELVKNGVVEIMLLGQNVNSYGKNLESPITFAELLRRVERIEGLKRIRFMTSHPKDLSEKLIQAYVDCDKLCNYIHLPVQSGSSRVLKRMNRRYDRERYLDLVQRLRGAVPDITISTDIIVGFPGETEEDFEDTLDLVNQVQYDSAFTFLYSIRKGTPAEKFEDQIPEDVKHARFERLVEAVNTASGKKNAAYVGRIEKVLVEGVSKKNEETLTGRTEGFKLVDFAGRKDLIGQMVDVEITEGKTFSLSGKITEK